MDIVTNGVIEEFNPKKKAVGTSFSLQAESCVINVQINHGEKALLFRFIFVHVFEFILHMNCGLNNSTFLFKRINAILGNPYFAPYKTSHSFKK